MILDESTEAPEEPRKQPTKGAVVGTGKQQGNFKTGIKRKYIDGKSTYIDEDKENTSLKKKPSTSTREKKLHLYLGQVDKNTTSEDILVYLRKLFPKNEFSCLVLANKRENACFKIIAPYHLKCQMYESKIWPKGTFIRRYYYRQPIGNFIKFPDIRKMRKSLSSGLLHGLF